MAGLLVGRVQPLAAPIPGAVFGAPIPGIPDVIDALAHVPILDGETVITDEIIEVRAPFDGNLVGSVPRCGKEHLDRAVKAAHRELKANALAPWERAAILDRVAELLAMRSPT